MAQDKRLFERTRPAALDAKKRILHDFGQDPNVLGAGYGYRITKGQPTTTPAVLALVEYKLPLRRLSRSQRIPRRVEVGGQWIDIDVVETGPVVAHAYTRRERPVQGGMSVGVVTPQRSVTGTLGCVVFDKLANDSPCILSNNHVLADSNRVATGAEVHQPGDVDQVGRLPPRPGMTSTSPSGKPGSAQWNDYFRIGRLRRSEPIKFGGSPPHNRVDAAIADVSNWTNQIKGDDMTGPSPDQPAVGLLFAGGPSITVVNPMIDVLSALNIKLPVPGAHVPGTVNMHVQKTGRTTELTTGTITAVDTLIEITYYKDQHGNDVKAKFDGQYTTTPMSCPGDSGSVVCEGGDGTVSVLPCSGGIAPCVLQSAAEGAYGVPLSQDQYIFRQARDQLLSQTRVGRYLIAALYRNEMQIRHRLSGIHASASERRVWQALYAEHIGDLKLTLADPERRDIRVRASDVSDLEAALSASAGHFRHDERTAARRLLRLLRQHFVDSTGDEVLETLDRPRVRNEVRRILKGVGWLDVSPSSQVVPPPEAGEPPPPIS